MNSQSRFGTEVITSRSSRAYAEKYIASYADCLGETTYWDGQRSVPVLLVWEAVKNPTTGKWDVVATCSPREEN